MGYTSVILSQPQSASWLSLKNMIDHRIVIFGTKSITEEPDTYNGGQMRQVAVVDMVDLDDGRGGEIQWGVKVDKIGVVNKLSVDQRTAVMGRIQLGEQKAGQNAPFILAEHQPGDAEYFNNVWFPANKDALAGKGAPRPTTPPPAAPLPTIGQVQAASAPAPAANWVASGQAPTPQPQATPQPVAAAPADPVQYPPEALAAMQQLIASGQLVLPTH